MPKRRAPASSWSYTERYQPAAFGWKSSRPAVERLRQGHRPTARRVDPLVAAEGAVLRRKRLPRRHRRRSATGSAARCRFPSRVR